MVVPVWMLWMLTLALVLVALFGSVESSSVDTGSRRARIGRLWSPALVALLVASIASFDASRVSAGELREASERAAKALDGNASITDDQLEAAIETAVGHDISVLGPTGGPGRDRSVSQFWISADSDSDFGFCVTFEESRFTGIDDGPCPDS